MEEAKNETKIGLKFKFGAAHRLIFIDRCASLHGHTWKGEVIIEGDTNKGIVMDFYILKKIISEVLPDHCTILNEKDPLKDRLFGYAKILELHGEPTVENLAAHLAEKIQKQLPENIKVKSLRLSEGGNGFSVWEK